MLFIRFRWVALCFFPLCAVAQTVSVTCSEINYNSDPSTASGDWLELYNYGTSAVALGGFKLREQGTTNLYTIPQNTSIPAGGYLVLANDLTKFKTIYPSVSNVLGPITITFGNNGDTLELLNAANVKALTIGFDDSGDWPQCADGNGRTLENSIVNQATDLLKPTVWFDGCMGGSPGRAYTPCQEFLIFNEINYKSPTTADGGDWVELWNKTGTSLDLSGWQFRDSRDTLRYTFPTNTRLQPDSFLVIYNSLAKFQAIYGSSTAPNKIGPFQFALDGDGEVIRLFNKSEILQLSMSYNDAAPWPLSPDGEGPTLELRAPFTDLNKGVSWAASCGKGTPGRFNSPCAVPTLEPEATLAVKVSPNPSTGWFNVELDAADGQQWRVFNAQGQWVRGGNLADATPIWGLDLSDQPAGLYWLEIRGQNSYGSRKLVKE